MESVSRRIPVSVKYGNNQCRFFCLLFGFFVLLDSLRVWSVSNMQLKKAGSSGRVVGLDRKNTTLSTLRTAKIEGVQEYVTCREGDTRRLPFSDNYFDVVVSGLCIHKTGKENGGKRIEEAAAAAADRMRAVVEVVRVLKPGGVGVIWDLIHVPEYVKRLQELRMEDIRVSERVTAFMLSSHIVSFRKPNQHCITPAEVRLEWRCA